MSKIGEIPVNLHTGIPDISIPITEIDVSGFKVPISISYIASGLKTEEVPSNVGTGWVLQAGGQLNKLVVKYPDEGVEMDYVPHDSVAQIKDGFHNILTRNPANRYNWKYQEDLPDIYRAAAPGLECRFSGMEVVAPKKRAKVSKLAQSGYVLTNTEGIRYLFTLAEDSSLTYLTKIELPNGRNISIEYESFLLDMPGTNMKELYYQAQGVDIQDFTDDGLDRILSATTRKSFRISKIIFPTGNVEFVYSRDRKDLTGGSMLTSVKRYDKVDGDYLRMTGDVRFHQSYFVSYSFDQQQTSGVSDKFRSLFYRLRLDSVSFMGYSGPQTFAFKYNATALPPQNSLSQDHWGYYNGQQNQSLIRTFIRKDNSMSSYSNREANSTFAQAGILQEIVYPTGGRYKFEYELNTVAVQFPDYSSTYDSGGALNHKGVKVHPIPIVSAPLSPERFSGFNLEVKGTGSGLAPESVSFAVRTKRPLSAHPVYVSLSIVPLAVAGEVSKLRLDTVVVMSGTATFGMASFQKSLAPGLYRVLCGKLDRYSVNGETDGDLFVPSELTVQTGVLDPGVTPAPITAYQYPAGGLRIKKITLSDGVGPDQVQTFSYHQFQDPSRSSGSLGSLPSYIESVSELAVPSGQIVYAIGTRALYMYDAVPFLDVFYVPNMPVSSQMNQEAYSSIYFLNWRPIVVENYVPIFSSFLKYDPYLFSVRMANSSKVASKAVESYVGYANVTIDYGGNGKRELTYTNTGDAWQRGLLVSEKVYSKQGSSYALLEESTNTYAVDNGWDRPTSKVKTTLPVISGAPVVSERTVFSYRHPYFAFPSRAVGISSNGDSTVSERRYVLDFPGLVQNDDLSVGIKELFNRNILSSIIEEISYIADVQGVRRGVHSKFTEFKRDLPVPVRLLGTDRISTPGGFVAASVGSGKLIRSNSYRPLVEFNRYDSFGNPLEQRRVEGTSTAMIWGYDKSQLIAEVKNAKADDVYYESFEENAGTFDVQAKAGEKSYVGNYTMTFTPPSSRTDLLISYWTYSTGKWLLRKAPYVKGMVLSGDKIDEIRIFPPGAQMTSFTYKAGAGVLSRCDANNMYTYYDYDNTGKLIAIRDGDKHIREIYQYQSKLSRLY